MTAIKKTANQGTFKYLLIGDTVSNAGDRFQKIAFPLLLYKLTNSATILSLTVVLEIIPQFALSLVLGTILSRCDTKKVLYISVGLAALFTGVVPLLILVKAHYIFYLIVAMALAGVTLVYDITINTVIETLYPKKKLLHYNSILKSARTITKVIAPSIAGVWISAWGYNSIFIFNALSFIFLFYCVSVINFSTGNDRKSDDFHLQELLKRYKEIISSRALIIITIISIFINFMMLGFNSTLIYLLKHILNTNSSSVGIVYSLSGIGSLIGALLMTRVKSTNQTFLFKIMTGFSLILILAFILPLIVLNWQFVGACYLLISMSITCIDVIATTLVQERYGQPLLGFIFSALFVLSTALSPLGSVASTNTMLSFGASGLLIFFLVSSVFTFTISLGGLREIKKEEKNE